MLDPQYKSNLSKQTLEASYVVFYAKDLQYINRKYSDLMTPCGEFQGVKFRGKYYKLDSLC